MEKQNSKEYFYYFGTHIGDVDEYKIFDQGNDCGVCGIYTAEKQICLIYYWGKPEPTFSITGTPAKWKQPFSDETFSKIKNLIQSMAALRNWSTMTRPGRY